MERQARLLGKTYKQKINNPRLIQNKQKMNHCSIIKKKQKKTDIFNEGNSGGVSGERPK